MATTAKTKAKRAEARKTTKSSAKGAGGTDDAIALLEGDHREVEEYFDLYEKSDDDDEKADLAEKICLALTVHAQIEEEIFYPAARKATGDKDLLDEAAVEHACAKDLIAQIEGMEAGDELYDAKVKVLGEQIRHHVKEEEEELFPEVKKAKMDVTGITQQLAARKKALMAELGGEEK